MPTAENWIYGSTDGSFDRSAVPVGTIGEDVYFRRVLYLSYTLAENNRVSPIGDPYKKLALVGFFAWSARSE